MNLLKVVTILFSFIIFFFMVGVFVLIIMLHWSRLASITLSFKYDLVNLSSLTLKEHIFLVKSPAILSDTVEHTSEMVFAHLLLIELDDHITHVNF